MKGPLLAPFLGVAAHFPVVISPSGAPAHTWILTAVTALCPVYHTVPVTEDGNAAYFDRRSILDAALRGASYECHYSDRTAQNGAGKSSAVAPEFYPRAAVRHYTSLRPQLEQSPLRFRSPGE